MAQGRLRGERDHSRPPPHEAARDTTGRTGGAPGRLRSGGHHHDLHLLDHLHTRRRRGLPTCGGQRGAARLLGHPHSSGVATVPAAPRDGPRSRRHRRRRARPRLRPRPASHHSARRRRGGRPRPDPGRGRHARPDNHAPAHRREPARRHPDHAPPPGGLHRPEHDRRRRHPPARRRRRRLRPDRPDRDRPVRRGPGPHRGRRRRRRPPRRLHRGADRHPPGPPLRRGRHPRRAGRHLLRWPSLLRPVGAHRASRDPPDMGDRRPSGLGTGCPRTAETHPGGPPRRRPLGHRQPSRPTGRHRHARGRRRSRSEPARLPHSGRLPVPVGGAGLRALHLAGGD